MEKRFALFLALTFALLALNAVMVMRNPPKPVAKKDPAGKAAPAKPGEKPVKPADKKPADKPADEPPAPDKDQPEIKPAAAPAAAIAQQWITLGSADPASPYRMLVTLSNRGATVECIELNSPRYRDLDDRSGYLGFLDPADAKNRGGAIVRVVGPGTPAAIAGLAVDDVITAVGSRKIGNAQDLDTALGETEPDDKVDLTIERGGKKQSLSAALARRPLAVVRPEYESQGLDVVKPGKHDPFSLQLTLAQLGEAKLAADKAELKGLDMLTGNWEVTDSGIDHATFKKSLDGGIEVLKKYELAKGKTDDSDKPAYHLLFTIEIRNTADKAQEVAYRLDGPTGLPIEGAWYANKIGRNWGGAGLRDVVRVEGGEPTQINCTTIAADEVKPLGETPGTTLDFIAVDAQYFAAALLPQRGKSDDVWFDEIQPIRAGAVPADKAQHRLTNVTFRLVSTSHTIEPRDSLQHRYQFFAGPKQPDLLAKYGSEQATLGELVYYGWPIFVFFAKPMLQILHAFHSLVGNYGIAIIMLTVLVRGCMFPLSRKQALSAQKMQELQPEMKRIADKYKKQPELRTKAQQELFRKHNYNPLGGCLLMFIQLPIFIGLYRSLSVDLELRQAPLISEAIRWCSNLAAPDMFYKWDFMPEFVKNGTGFFGLGPYLNLLPLVTIGLFIWQQKMFMPPPADEQAAMQQKMMQYMMIFMGVMFFKVPSGLCIYFIASSLWGIAERKVLPKAVTVASAPPPPPPSSQPGTNGDGHRGGKKQRGKK